jgi:hypothetical protein
LTDADEFIRYDLSRREPYAAKLHHRTCSTTRAPAPVASRSFDVDAEQDRLGLVLD